MQPKSGVRAVGLPDWTAIRFSPRGEAELSNIRGVTVYIRYSSGKASSLQHNAQVLSPGNNVAELTAQPSQDKLTDQAWDGFILERL